VVAFGFLYGIIPWADEAGYVNYFGALAGIYVGVVAIGGMSLLVFGARLRQAQASWRIIL
jgi:membrane associated rhomboid family serine protease